MNTTLLIMAAGIGSRFGTGIKQLEPVDDANHIIMDYSIHDAIEAGFNHVVFIIRKDIEKEFKEVIYCVAFGSLSGFVLMNWLKMWIHLPEYYKSCFIDLYKNKLQIKSED